jgi:hypothetical protein
MRGLKTKKEFVMKQVIKNGTLALAALTVLFLGCDNFVEKQPFQAGLGRMVDLETPVFSLDSHGASAFIRGTETFSGSATDDVGVREIKVSVKNGPYTDVVYSAETERWTFTLDLTTYDDGPFSLQFRVWDNSGRNPLTTGKYAFTVKNSHPSLNLQIPYVDGSMLGSQYNQVAPLPGSPPPSTGFNDPHLNHTVMQTLTATPSNGNLIGMVTDLSGIDPDYPQVKFWPAFADGAADPMVATPSIGMPGDTYGDWQYAENDPSPDVDGDILFGGWYRAEVNLSDRAENSFTFTFPLRKRKAGSDYQDPTSSNHQITEDPLDVGLYRFLIKVKDNLPGSEEIIYPVYYAFPDPRNADYPNEYLELRLEAPAAAPIVTLYDLIHPIETDSGHPAISTNNSGIHGATYQAPHPYIDDGAIANKNGLRPNSLSTPPVPTDSFFVLRVHASHGDGIRNAELSVRKEGSSVALPNIYFNNATGPAAGENIPLSDPQARLFTYRAPWSFFTTHGDGTYVYTVKVSSKSGVDATENYTIKVDTVQPRTQINSILSATQSLTNEKVFTVNGQIKIKGLAYDSDTGIRNEAGSVRYFFIKNAGATLTAADFRTALTDDTAFMGGDLSSALNPWKNFGGFISGTPFTTGLIDTASTTMFPGGDGEYTLFILSQDAAYNRYIDEYPVTVNQGSDVPKVEAAGLDPAATKAGIESGGFPGNVIGNAFKFTIRLEDDDALNTGTGSGVGSVVVKIKGSNKEDGTEVAVPPEIPSSEIVLTRIGETRANFEITQDQIAAALYGSSGSQFPVGTALRDGIYTLIVSVDDKQSAAEAADSVPKSPVTGTQEIVFAKNTKDPRVTFTEPLSGNYYQGLITVTGVLEDDGPIATNYLQISLPKDPASGDWTRGSYNDAFINYASTNITAYATNPSTTDGKYRYNFSIPGVDVGTIATENFTIGLEAQDVYGRKTANVQVVIKVDTEPPVVEIMESEFNHLTSMNGKENNVNGNVGFKAYIFDGESGLPTYSAANAPRYWFLPAAASAPSWDTAGSTPLNAPDSQSRFGATLDTRSYSGPGDYILWVLAKDKSGKVGSNSFALYLDQSTDLPWLDFETLTPYRSVNYDPLIPATDYTEGTPATYAVEAIADSGILISAVIYDDDGFNTAHTVEIQYWDGSGTEPAVNAPDITTEWKVSAVNSVGGASIDVNAYQFNFHLPTDAAEAGFLGTGEGPRKYRYRISDALPAGKNGDTTATTEWKQIYFILDRQAPEITFVPPPPDSNPKGSDFKKPGDPDYATGSFIEGTVSEAYLNIFKYVDYSMYISPTQSINGRLTLTGSSPYSWKITYEELDNKIKTAGLTGGWYESTPGAGDGLPDQNYVVKFLVTDDSNSMTTADWNFSKDSTGPVITFNIEPAATPGSASILKTVRPSLKGSLRDANTLTPGDVARTFYYRFDDEYTGPAQQPEILTNWRTGTAEGLGNNVNWEIDLLNSTENSVVENRLADGIHRLNIKAQDALGSWSQVYTNVYFKIDTTAPLVSHDNPTPPVYQVVNNSSTVVLTGTASDNLFASITAEIGKAGDATLLPLSSVPAGSWSIEYKNSSNNWVTTPAWTETTTPGAGTSRAVVWRITLRGELLLHSLLGPDANFQNYTLRVTAHDEAARTSRTEWGFRNDRTPPGYTLISTPVDGKIYLQETNPRIQATIVDPSGVSTVTAVVQKYTYSTGAWTAAGAKTLADLGISAGETVNWTLPLGATGTNPLTLPDGYYRLQITPTDQAGNQATYPAAGTWQEFYIDRNNPGLTVTSPAPSSILRDTVVGGDHFIPVNITTDDGTAPATGFNKITRLRAKLVLKGTSADSVPWPVDSSAASYLPASYAASYTRELKATTATYDANGYIPSGEYTLYVMAEDSGGRSTVTDFNLTIDNSPPELAIESPWMGAAAGTTVTVNGVDYTLLHQPLEVFGKRAFVGSTNDNNTVQRLHYFLGQTPPAVGDSSAPGWESTTDWKKTGFNGTNSEVMTTWAGTYSWQLDFPNIDRFLYKLNPGNEYVNPALYVGATPVNPALTGGREIWELPLYFRVEDSAGNVGLYRQNLWLDPDGSVPKTYIETHADDVTVGGAITVGGTATDDFGVYDISFRVWKLDSSGNRVATVNLKDGSHYSDYVADARTSSLTGVYAGGNWFRYSNSAALSGLSPIAWSFVINNYGELNPTAGNAVQRVEVEVFSWDANEPNYGAQGDNHGVPDSVKLRFSNTAPVIENVKITTASGTYANAPYTAGMKFTGTFTLEAHVWAADASNGLNSISYRGEEMTAAQTFTGTGSYNLPGGAGTVTVSTADYVKAGFVGYKVTVTGLDPEKLQSSTDTSWGQSRYKDKGAVYGLNLKVEDNLDPTHYYAEQRFEFRIDNFFPTAALTGTAALGSLSGSSALLSGTFTDDDTTDVSGGASGLQKVVVWFTRGAVGVPLDAAATVPHIYTTASASGRNGDSAPTSTLIPNYPNITPNRVSYPDGPFQPEMFYSGVSIDYAGESTVDKDLDRCVEFFDPLSGAWSVRLNTENIGSGPITLNYAVFDEVGNGRYYSKDIVIQNRKPVIGTVILYSDMYGKTSDGATPVYTPFVFDGNLETARNAPGTLLNTIDNDATGFAVRKKHLSFTVLVNGGNNKLNFRVTYKDAGNTTHYFEEINNIPTSGGLEYQTITIQGSDFDTIPELDDGIFEIKVWDAITTGGEGDQLSDTRRLGVIVDNVDAAPPRVLIHDLNPLLETGRESTDAATLAAVAQPVGIGSDNNRNLPGIYNRGTEAAPVPSGHIEPREKSVLGNELGEPTFATDTVSGKVIVRGSAFDKHRVKEVYLGIGTGAGVYGTQVLKSERDGVTNLWKLVAVTAGKAWVFEEWRLDGHYVEWAYEWDSESLPAGLIAGASSLKARAVDAGTSPNSPDIAWNSGASPTDLTSAFHEYNNIAVELAPFILDIPGSSRSTQGWYSIYREDTPAATHSLTGYNLKTAGNSTLYIGDGASGSPANLTITNVDKNNLTFRLTSTTRSGKIVLKTSTGVEAANSRLTKINSWNLEQQSAAGREIWDHSRFAHIWRAKAGDFFASSNGGSDFSMAVNPVDAGLWAAWVNRGTFKTYHSFYNNNATKNTIYILDSHDAQRETDVFLNTGLHTGNADTQGTDAELDNGTRQSGVTVAYMNLAAYTHDHSGTGDTGGIAVYNKNAPNYARTAVDGLAYPMEDVRKSASDHVSTRFNRPRVVVRSTGTANNQNRIHTSYYDNISKQLRYSSTLSAADPFNMAVDGSAATENVGAWSAIDYLSDGRPIIAYYSDTNETVKLAYGNTTFTTAMAWTRADLLASTDDYYRGSGLYVALRVDRKGTNASDIIHVSFYNSRNNTMVYATGKIGDLVTSANGGRGSFNFESMEVDTNLSGGNWADLSLDPQGNPWISYRDQTGFRVAHRNITEFTKPSVDRLGHDNTGWDAAVVPTPYGVLDGRLNIETINSTLAGTQGWNAAVGFLSDDYFRVAYRTPADLAAPGWWDAP